MKEPVSSSAVPSDPSLARGGWYLAGLLTLVQIVSYIDRYLPSLIIPSIKADLRLSDFQVGLLLGPAFALFYIAVGLPFGWAADRLSRRGILAFAITTWSLMTSAASLATSFGFLFTARLGVGFGEAAVAPCAISMIGDRFDRTRRSRAISLYMTGTFIGAGSAFLIGGPLVHAIEAAPPLVTGMKPWQSVFLVMGLPGIALALMMATLREPVRRELTQSAPASLVHALRFITLRWRAFGALFVGSACVVTLGSLSLWNVALFQRTWHWNVGQVGVVTGLFFFTASPLGSLLGVFLTQRWLRRGRVDAPLRVVMLGLLIAAPCFILFPLAPTATLGVCGMFIAFIGQAMATAAGPLSLTFLAPGEIRSQATAVYYLIISVAGQFLGPPLVGWLVDLFGHPSALRYAVSIEALAVSAPALILVALGLKAYRSRAEELELAAGELPFHA